MTLLDDFFVRALVAGIGVALVVGPLGCFVVWRRMAYFGDTLSHSALLGVGLAFLFEVNVTLAVFAVLVAVSVALVVLQRRRSLSSDVILGLLSHSALALGLVSLAFVEQVPVDLMGFLFGDILAVSKVDIAVIYGGGALVLAGLIAIWRPLFAATVSADIARAEGLDPERANLIFVLLMAVVVAIAMKIVGVLLIPALMIIPAAAARRFAGGPETMAVLASAIGAIAVVGGLFGSMTWDTPSGPSIVVAALAVFLAAQIPFAALVKTGARP
ncbi:Zinc ABC transporter, permease protein ZnuB [hydrothermal vent metagenome]|uniref:High-affinity zinc uptake system membrane protein ZnuB n=1 Tax=hydrothermal vent metagenome TaxID=652676 RepID=A0A3B0TBB8_9ZZZZ